MKKSIEALLQAAKAVKDRAYAPYSRFFVGAALLAGNGEIYAGCNVENLSYGMTICAERNAIFQMVAAGERKIEKLLVIGNTDDFLTPCGGCRQVVSEFASPSTPIYLCNRDGEWRETTLEALLPMAPNFHKDLNK